MEYTEKELHIKLKELLEAYTNLAYDITSNLEDLNTMYDKVLSGSYKPKHLIEFGNKVKFYEEEFNKIMRGLSK